MKKINPIILDLLNKRGIETEEDIKEFFSETPQKTYDPFLLLNMEAGVDFVLKGIKEKKNICIYGDYDADGITSIVILKNTLEHIIGRKDSVNYYIPLRIEEGYGLSKEALDKIKDSGTDIVITVDCGASSHEEVKYAKSIGLDILITDHHTVSTEKLDCSMINPRQEECSYPFKDLAGCGVAFKLSQGLLIKSGLDSKFIHDYLDVLAIGTVADIVPLVDENRTFVKYGLKSLARGDRKNLACFLERVGANRGTISTRTIGYIIAPHINAAGRMGDPRVGVELFLEVDESKVEGIIEALISQNNKRKKEQEEILEKCKETISQQCAGEDFLVIYLENAHEGITGIVAGRLKEDYNRPVIIVTDSKGGLKGTSRSVDTIDLHEFLKNNNDIFLKFGGHKGACGFSLEKKDLPILRERIKNKIGVMKKNDKNLFSSYIKADIICDVEDLTLELAEEVELMAPFGTCNENIIFQVSEATTIDKKTVGDEGKHAKFKISKSNKTIDCIMFFPKELEKNMVFSDIKVNVLGHLSVNEYKRWRNPQIEVKGISRVNNYDD